MPKGITIVASLTWNGFFFTVSPTSGTCQPAPLACTVLASGWGSAPGPWGSSRPTVHAAAATRAWGPLAAPWVHSKASDSASFPPTPAPTGRGQHWPQVSVRRKQDSGRELFPVEIFTIRSTTDTIAEDEDRGRREG